MLQSSPLGGNLWSSACSLGKLAAVHALHSTNEDLSVYMITTLNVWELMSYEELMSDDPMRITLNVHVNECSELKIFNILSYSFFFQWVHPFLVAYLFWHYYYRYCILPFLALHRGFFKALKLEIKATVIEQCTGKEFFLLPLKEKYPDLTEDGKMVTQCMSRTLTPWPSAPRFETEE